MDKHRNPDGTYNGVSALADYSGLTKAEIRAIVERVKANNAKLDGCAYHVFDRIDDLSDPASFFRHKQRYRCRHCGGDVDGHQHHWHELGRRERPRWTEADEREARGRP